MKLHYRTVLSRLLWTTLISSRMPIAADAESTSIGKPNCQMDEVLEICKAIAGKPL